MTDNALHVPDLLSEADAVLAGHKPPARRDPMDVRSVTSPSAVATSGGPGFTLPLRPAFPRFAGHLPPDPWPGSPPSPPPTPSR